MAPLKGGGCVHGLEQQSKGQKLLINKIMMLAMEAAVTNVEEEQNDDECENDDCNDNNDVDDGDNYDDDENVFHYNAGQII